ncbi:TonB-dependent receptor [Gimibacter soli]|uniref:TonB-dependent receptor n=1 Tax=Gimibacter soli TaxID=3024400 RepID=A0AAE9XT25_9PROT|nr:TonB-dependent receptor [Gimibacter soli]WCL52698.1 TonB-dependent receptor [Gimibacter soli]
MLRNQSTVGLYLQGVCAAALLATSAPVLAQDAGAEERLSLEEIVVTARRREESLQDVPVAVSAFTAEQLEMRGTADITELAQSVPGLTLEASRATNSTLTAFIRGVGQQDPLAGYEQGVALYIDDVFLARPQGALLDIYDVERIEVLRGPQGTLYGRNAVGGAIKYVTKRLADEPEASVKLSYGSYNQIDAIGKVSLPLGDTVRFGAAVASLNRDGFGKNLTTGEENYNKQVFAIRASLELLPSDDVFMRFSFDQTDDDSNALGGHRFYPANISGNTVLKDVYDTEAGASENASTAGIDGNNEVKSKGFHGLVEWNASESLTLKSITAFRTDYTESVIDFDALPVDDADAPVIYDNRQFSQEFQAQYTSEKLNGVLGFYYLDATASNDFDVVLGQLGRIFYGLPLVAYTGGVVDTKAASLFGDFTYDVTDDFSVSVGGRYTHDKRSADVFRANYFGLQSPFFGNASAPLVAVTSDFENERTYKNFSPRVVLAYDLTDDANVYASYSRGFKAGMFDPRGANFLNPEIAEGVKPEILDSFEAGLKSTWLDGRLRTNIAVYYSDYKDMQIPGSLIYDSDNDGTDDSFAGTLTNAGKSTIKGIELEGTALLTEELTAQFAVSLLDAKIKEWDYFGQNVADQRRMQNTPEFMSNLALNYNRELSTGRLNLNAAWAHKSSVVQFEVPYTELDQGPTDIFNASIVWTSEDGMWSLGLHGKNIFDERYRTSGYYFPTLGLENNTTVYYGAPRTVTATLGVNF